METRQNEKQHKITKRHTNTVPDTFISPQGKGWIFLDWKASTDGRKVVAYKIQRRERPAGPWVDVGLAMEAETMLHDQERGKEWEYRVIAANEAGEGEASNTVMAVL